MPRDPGRLLRTSQITMRQLGCPTCEYAGRIGLPPGLLFCNGPVEVDVDPDSGRCLAHRSPDAKGDQRPRYVPAGPHPPRVRARTSNSPSEPGD